MNTDNMGCMQMQDNSIVKEIQLGSTKVKFSYEFVAKTKEERNFRLKVFKQNIVRLLEKSNIREGKI